MKRLLIVVVLFHLACQLSGIMGQPVETDFHPPAWRGTLAFGCNVIGPGASVMDQMESAGLNDHTPISFLGGGKEHPKRTLSLFLQVGLRKQGNERSGVEISAGIAALQRVTGYEAIGNGNFLTLSTRLFNLKGLYLFSTQSGRNHIATGLVTSMLNVTQKNATTKVASENHFLPGLSLGYGAVLSKNWQKPLKLLFSLDVLTPAKVGPFISEHQTGIATSSPETHTSILPAFSTGMIHAAVGLQLTL